MQVSTSKRGLALLVTSAAIWSSHGDLLAQAQQSPQPTRTAVSFQDEVKSAVSRGLAAVSRSAAAYPRHRSCFSCHHQTLPMLSQVTALAHGFTIDNDQLHAQRQLTLASFAKQVADLNEGKRIGGRAMTVAYGLWALQLGPAVGDAKTVDAERTQRRRRKNYNHVHGRVSAENATRRGALDRTNVPAAVGRVVPDVHRAGRTGPPQIRFRGTAASSRRGNRQGQVMAHDGAGQEPRGSRRTAVGVNLLESAPDGIATAREAVMKAQRPDGGWAQLDEMESDAYATGQTLYVLQATGLDATQECYERRAREVDTLDVLPRQSTAGVREPE